MPPARTLTPPYSSSPTPPTLDMRLDEGGEGGPDARAGAAQTAQAMPKGARPSGPSDQVMSAIPPPRSPSQQQGSLELTSRPACGGVEGVAWGVDRAGAKVSAGLRSVGVTAGDHQPPWKPRARPRHRRFHHHPRPSCAAPCHSPAVRSVWRCDRCPLRVAGRQALGGGSKDAYGPG